MSAGLSHEIRARMHAVALRALDLAERYYEKPGEYLEPAELRTRYEMGARHLEVATAAFRVLGTDLAAPTPAESDEPKGCEP